MLGVYPWSWVLLGESTFVVWRWTPQDFHKSCTCAVAVIQLF